MSGFKSVLKEAEDTDVIYYSVSPPIPVVATREWLQRRVLRRDFPTKGMISILYYSVHLEGITVKKGWVRAETDVAGSFIL